MSTTTLDGYVPAPGDLVWQQMYSPCDPAWDSTLAERIASGCTYGPRRLMEVVTVTQLKPEDRANEHDRAQWLLQDADPADRRGEFPYSSVTDNWCLLEDANVAEGRLW